MKNKILWLTLGIAVATFFAGCSQNSPEPPAVTGQKWTCPMHPSVVRDQPGKCPICGMTLVPIQPAVETIPGRATVELTGQQEKLIGLRVEPVRKLDATKFLNAPGRVHYVEGNYAHLSFRAKGFVEKLYVNGTGQAVKAGDPLMDVYSPDLLVAQREFLFALQLAEKPETRADPNAIFMAQTLFGAATQKLELLGLTVNQIADLEKSRVVQTHVTIYSPLSGVVDHKGIAVKQMITEAEHLDIVDLSTVWVVADLYETELPLVRVGQEATIQAAGDFTFKGKVSFISPSVDEKTRAGQVRLEVPNPDLLLKPQMFARVEIQLPLGEKIVVPTEAIFDQGTRQYLYLATGEGRYEPREVTLGPRANVKMDGKSREVFVVEKGVAADESVVVSGNFLLDSESNQRASASSAPKVGMSGTPEMKREQKEMKHVHAH